MLLQAALNGTRTRTEHPAIPLAPEHHASEATEAVAHGADAIHVHVRDGDGHESLAADDVARTLEAIRHGCPGVPIGISTGAWIVPNLCRRMSQIAAWDVVPDFASVNLHEIGAAEVIRLLLKKGIGVEAGIWNAPAAVTLRQSGLANDCMRILIEPAEGSGNAHANFLQIEEALGALERPRLLHGLGACAWYFVNLAFARGYATRAGFEDTLLLPNGTRAVSNAALIAAAKRIQMRHIETIC